jgi:hypothetical protein
MKLDEFISTVLVDINLGLGIAKEKTQKYYTIESSKGVSFDIAVTTLTSKETVKEGGAKVGIVEVLGAKVGIKDDSTQENSNSSRIQFTVYIPPRTIEEERQEQLQVQAENERMSERLRNL